MVERPWPPARIALWIIVCSAVVFWQWNKWPTIMKPHPWVTPEGELVRTFADFSQDWLSGKNYLAGQSVYLPLPEAYLMHTGGKPERSVLYRNAHPPTCVLITLPYASFEYEVAHFYWNLTMLGCLAVSLALALPRRKPPFCCFDLLWLIPLIAVCFPIVHHFVQGQISLLLTFLIVLAWAADQRGYEVAAGSCVAIATAIKIVPAFLLVYWLALRRWRVLTAAAITFMVLNAVTCAILGSETYRAYILVALPELEAWLSEWWNLSLPGFWRKLFDPINGASRTTATIALWESPMLARALSILSQIVIAVIVYRCCRAATSAAQRAHAFGLAVIGLLLISPLTWCHYLTMLIVPLCASNVQSLGTVPLLIYRACFILLWLPQPWLVQFASQENRYVPAAPWQTLTFLSLQTYSLIVIFYLYWRSRPTSSAISPFEDSSLQTCSPN